MSKHNETGIKGEQLAENFLLAKGYSLLHRNWRFGKKEIDLIVLMNDMVVFVEVKTRSRIDYGFPEEAVDHRKQSFMKTAAEAFLEQNPQFKNIRFDVVSIFLEHENPKEIIHFEDAFY
jgi:putative endonuclease